MDDQTATLLCFLDYKRCEGKGSICFSKSEASVVLDLVENIHAHIVQLHKEKGVKTLGHSQNLIAALQGEKSYDRNLWAMRNRNSFYAIKGGKQ
ncbi:hypothetical protein [Kiloniella litopenaei]|uniref:hypothetical protein n=1 Tax=Kiloniella litopenaei TaxID=1549748 RepID=UPI003BA850DD